MLATKLIPQELDAVRAQIEGLYVARDRRGGLTYADQERYVSLLATEARLLAQMPQR